MRDLLLVAAILFASAVVGYPACLLLPAETFRARFVVAPTIGFAVLSASIICLYKLGISPQISLYAMCAAGLSATIAHVLHNRQRRAQPLAPTVIELGGATVAIVVLCLLPAWIGGAQFTVFQGNVYDQFNVYLPGSVVFHQYDYATVMAAGASGNPVMGGAQFALNRPISVVYAAFVGTHATAAASSYAFTVALQVIMFFSALFLALHVFEAKKRIAIIVAGALTLGFFQQYVLDINAWAQLSTQPIYLVVVAIVVLAFDPLLFGARPGEALARLILFFALLMAAATLLYPDSCGVYGVAEAAAAFISVIAKKPWTTKAMAFAGLGLGTVAALSVAYWYGLLAFLESSQVAGRALSHINGWKYFQAYLLGRTENHVAVLAGGPIVPVVFLFSGFYWTAGKSFSIAAPLLFFFTVALVLSGIPMRPLARAAIMLFLVGHLVTGLLRPIFAADSTGTKMVGLPDSAPAIESQKAGMDWRMDRLAEQLHGCHGVILNIKHGFMNLMAQLVAADVGVSWASLHPVDLGYAVRPPYKPAGWSGRIASQVTICPISTPAGARSG